MKPKKPLLLIVSFAIVFLAALAGSVFTSGKVGNWYAGLIKPSFNPPNWVFSPVWTILYILMAAALYLVWSHKGEIKKVRQALKAFFVQLIFNSAWSIIFFGMENIIGALILIFALWLAIAYTINRFSKVSRLASYLLYPYIVWVTFATVLNYSIWVLNK